MRVAIVLRIAFVFGIICLALFGCKTVQSSSSSTNTKADTVRVKEFVYIKDSSHTTAPVNTNIQLGNPCDSMGRLLKYYQTLKVGNDSVTIDTRSGSLVISTNKEATVSTNNTQVHNKDSGSISVSASTEKTHTVETVVKNAWWVKWLVGYAILMTIIAGFCSYIFFQTLFIRLKQ